MIPRWRACYQMAVQFSMAVLDDLALRTAINEAVMADMPDEKSMQPPSLSGPTPSSAATWRR